MATEIKALDAQEKRAISILIGAIEAQPERNDPDLMAPVEILSKYISGPTGNLFYLAKMAFDDIPPSIKGAIHDDAVALASQRISSTRRQPAHTGSINRQTPTSARKKGGHASPYLAAIQGG